MCGIGTENLVGKTVGAGFDTNIQNNERLRKKNYYETFFEKYADRKKGHGQRRVLII
jgi:hypothetical protein